MSPETNNMKREKMVVELSRTLNRVEYWQKSLGESWASFHTDQIMHNIHVGRARANGIAKCLEIMDGTDNTLVDFFSWEH